MGIKLLDCTLRDGGYVNEWRFGAKTISETVYNLTESGMDFIEMGFMESKPYNEDVSLFRYVSDFKKFIPKNKRHSKYYGMITFGKYNQDDIPVNDGTSVDGLRVIFKKDKIKEALDFCRVLKQKKYELFINPTYIDQFSDKELLDIIEQVNDIHPTGFSIVDTMGVMNSENTVRVFKLIDKNLKPDISVCFHSHNNLQQSFTNAKALSEIKTNRDLIVDVSVMGIGRGAGNLNSELMISYLNQKYGAQYNLLHILKIIDEHISKIYAKTPWGYSMPYFLAASVKCHPNYATYLINKQTLSVEAIDAILHRIPNENKTTYNEELIKQLYLDYQKNTIDDTVVVNNLKSEIISRPVLIIAPGKTIKTHQSKIKHFVSVNNPFIMSINFRPSNIKVDKIFISNVKRFSEQKDLSDVIVTSNIKTNLPTLNYAYYLNNSEMYDNSVLMLLSLLIKMGVKNIYAAGLDGFCGTDNYADPDMINNSKLGEFDKRNEIMSKMIKYFEKQIKIKFITPSLYRKKA